MPPPRSRSQSRSARRRQRNKVIWRRRAAVAVVAAAIIGVLLAALAGGSNGHRHPNGGTSQPVATGKSGDATPAAAQAPAVEAGLMPWSLHLPLSRMSVFPDQGANLTVAGGLTPSGSSTSSVNTLNTASGTLAPAGTLASAVHDAAAAVVSGRGVIFGGGSPSTFATVQAVPAPGSPTGSALSQLPRPRSDAAAVTIGPTTYVVGGYDGAAPTPEVLSTADGRTFHQVATLPVPVRYPAVAAMDGAIYLFGGLTVTGGGQPTGGQSETQSGQITDVIQRVDPGSHSSGVIGHLPMPLEAAAAFTLQGHLYVAGGESPQASPAATGVGTTQLNGWATASGASSEGNPVGTVWAFNPTNGKVDNAGHLQVPVSNAGVAVSGGKAWLVGGESGNKVLGTVQVLSANASFGIAGQPGAGSPYYGTQLLVADRGNNRLLLMNPAMQTTWTYPSPTTPPDPLGFYFPDDAFFVNHGTEIISNQEENETIVQIGYPSGAITWSYGHPKQAGTAPGYLHEPDDAYLLRDGQISVADAQNCRVLVINPGNKAVASQIGTDGSCVHRPPASMGSPNGDTPLWDGNLLVSEINGSWVSEYTTSGHLAWAAQLPISYPSDPQQLGASASNNADRYLVADYATPGEVLQFTREGQVLSTYRVTTGPGALDHPSLAEELPNGIYMINDDDNNRMVAIDPTDGALVWQYGVTKQAGSSAGMLNTPDGFDVLGPNGTTPTHPQTG